MFTKVLVQSRHPFHGTKGVLHSIFPCPFPCRGFVTGTVRLVHVGNIRHQRIIRIGVSQHRADGEQNLRDCQRRRPLVSEDIQTNRSIRVDVWVIDLRCEAHFGRFERIINRKGDGKEEDTASVWRITRSHNRCLPLEHVFARWSSAAGRGGVTAEVNQFLVNALQSHYRRAVNCINC